MDDLKNRPWWAVFGGLVGAVQVVAGLTLVGRAGAGTFISVTVSAALVASLLIDHFGWFRMEVHSVTPLRALIHKSRDICQQPAYWRSLCRNVASVDRFLYSIFQCFNFECEIEFASLHKPNSSTLSAKA